jgi:hypothetical protein
MNTEKQMDQGGTENTDGGTENVDKDQPHNNISAEDFERFAAHMMENFFVHYLEENKISRLIDSHERDRQKELFYEQYGDIYRNEEFDLSYRMAIFSAYVDYFGNIVLSDEIESAIRDLMLNGSLQDLIITLSQYAAGNNIAEYDRALQMVPGCKTGIYKKLLIRGIEHEFLAFRIYKLIQEYLAGFGIYERPTYHALLEIEIYQNPDKFK